MPDPIGWAVLVVGALVGSLVGGVAGFGTGIIMLPLVAWVVGLRSAVPVLTVAMTIGNLSRIWWSRGELDRAVVLRFALGAMPATVLGTAIYAGAPTDWLGRFVGVFLIASVPLRRILATDLFRMRLRYFPVLGAIVGLVSGLIVTTGPLNTPFFLSYGLRRNAYVGTEAVCAMVEDAAGAVMRARNPPGGGSVGTMVEMKHLAATPVGMKVRAKATLLESDGKRYLFSVEAWDEKEKIAEGRHERFVVPDMERFLARAMKKRAS